MKHAWSPTSQSALDAALQLRTLATGRLHDALTEHTITARRYFVGLTKTEQRKLAGNLAARLGMIAPADSLARLLVHLGQIHGDLSQQVANHLSTSSSRIGLSVQITRDPAHKSQPIKYIRAAKIYQGVEG